MKTVPEFTPPPAFAILAKFIADTAELSYLPSDLTRAAVRLAKKAARWEKEMAAFMERQETAKSSIPRITLRALSEGEAQP